jgi:hypothetical protein
MNILLIIYVCGIIPAYLMTRCAWRQMDDFNKGTRVICFMFSVLSWLSFVAWGLISICFYAAKNDDKPSKW